MKGKLDRDSETRSEYDAPFEQAKDESGPRDQTQYSASQCHAESNSGKPSNSFNDANDNASSDPGNPVEIVVFVRVGEFYPSLV